VRAQASFGLHNPDRCLAGANALAPDLMTAEERLTEVGQILAAGFLRSRRPQSISVAAPRGDFQVDFPLGRSVHTSPQTRWRRRA
jgi:hypothetical protein